MKRSIKALVPLENYLEEADGANYPNGAPDDRKIAEEADHESQGGRI